MALLLGNAEAAETELRRARSKGADPNLIMVPLARAYLLQNKPRNVIEEIFAEGNDSAFRAEILVLRGQAYLELDEWFDAEGAFQEAHELAPGSPAPVVGLGRVAFSKGDLEGARRYVEAALEKTEPSHAAWRLMGDVLNRQDQNDAAIEAYGRAIEISPTNIYARLSRAALLIGAGQPRQALVDVDRVLEILPNDPRANYLAARAYAQQDRADDAEAALNRAAVSLDRLETSVLDQNRSTIRTAGLVHYSLGQYERAVRFFERLVALSPNSAPVHVMLARTQIRIGNYASAIENLKTALLIDDGNVLATGLLGTAYMLSGEPDKAHEYLATAAAQDPTSPGAHLRLGMGLLRLGESGDAVSELERAASQDPDALGPRILLTIAHLSGGDAEAAIAAAKTAVEFAPDRAYIHNLAGVAYMAARQYGPARQHLERALALDGELLPAQLNLARLEAQQKNYEAAREQYRRVLNAERDHLSALMELADLALVTGQAEEAESWLERARDSYPDDPVPWARSIDFYEGRQSLDRALELGWDYLSRHAQSVSVMKRVARALWRAGRLREAADTYRELITLAPNRAAVLYRLAGVQEAMGEIEPAIRSLRRAVAWDRKNATLWRRLITLEARSGDIEEALTLIDDFGEERPDLRISPLAAEVFLAGERYADALAAYDEAMKITPDDPDLALGRYKALRGLTRFDEALAFLEDWLAKHPDATPIRSVLASGYAAQGDTKRAIALHETLLRDSPQNAALMNNLAVLYDRAGNVARARELGKKAVALAPEHAGILDSYGWILVRAGNVEEGLAHLRNAQARAGGDARIHYHIAVALAELGRREEARAALTAALDSAQDFGERPAAAAMLRDLSAQ